MRSIYFSARVFLGLKPLLDEIAKHRRKMTEIHVD